MAYRHEDFSALQRFIPVLAVPYIVDVIRNMKIHLTITKQRSSKYGDYNWDQTIQRHKISVNGTLNRYEFLITLLHEIAHAICHDRYQRSVFPHGTEWKAIYQSLLLQFLEIDGVFPNELIFAIRNHISNIKYTHSADISLHKALRKYSERQYFTVSDLEIGQQFSIIKGGTFQILEKMRTRYKCKEIGTNNIYIFPGNYEIIFN